MSDSETSIGCDFIEDRDASIDPNLHYRLTETASGRTAIPAGSDLNWSSSSHFVGRFWVIPPLNDEPELVSYRQAFNEVEIADDLYLDLHPSQSLDLCWRQLQSGDQHLTPHQRTYVENRDANEWPRGHVAYDPHNRTWLVRIASDLLDDDAVLLAARRRFTIDPARCRVVGDGHLN
jgi:hypothetical protein